MGVRRSLLLNVRWSNNGLLFSAQTLSPQSRTPRLQRGQRLAHCSAHHARLGGADDGCLYRDPLPCRLGICCRATCLPAHRRTIEWQRREHETVERERGASNTDKGNGANQKWDLQLRLEGPRLHAERCRRSQWLHHAHALAPQRIAVIDGAHAAIDMRELELDRGRPTFR
jgi:hypothetical protein